MHHYADAFFLFAVVAGLFGFGGLLGSAAGIAKLLFVVLMVLFVVSLILDGRTDPRAARYPRTKPG